MRYVVAAAKERRSRFRKKKMKKNEQTRLYQQRKNDVGCSKVIQAFIKQRQRMHVREQKYGHICLWRINSNLLKAVDKQRHMSVSTDSRSGQLWPQWHTIIIQYMSFSRNDFPRKKISLVLVLYENRATLSKGVFSQEVYSWPLCAFRSLPLT